MKRSEMIKILEEVFFHYDNYTNIAEKALSTVEDRGMLPPFNEEKFIMSKNEYGIECANGNQWESEE